MQDEHKGQHEGQAARNGTAGPAAPDDAALDGGYNTHAVERLTGVPAPTFRAWERRYGVPSPHRLPDGQRVYSEQDVATVRWLREQTERGLTASRAVAQLRHGTGPAEPAPRSSFLPAELAASVVRAALSYDTAGLERALSQALSAHPLETVCLEVVQPALVEIGEQWHRGQITPAVEHFASGLVRRRLEQLAAVLDHGHARPLVVVGSAPGELHDVGALIVSLLLRQRGLRVVFLGAAVPLDAALDAVRQLRPDLFCLSAATRDAARTLAEVGQALEALPEPRPAFGFGGRAFVEEPELVAQMPGQYLGADARGAAEAAEALLVHASR